MQWSRKGINDELVQRYGEAPGAAMRLRMRWLLAGFGLLLTLLGLRLAQLHTNPMLELSREDKAHIGQVELQQPRGEIWSANHVLLAGNTTIPSLWADPREIADRAAFARAMHEALGVDEGELLARLVKRDELGRLRRFEWVRRWIDDRSEAELEALAAAHAGALVLEREPARWYPQGDTAAHVLGFVNRAGEASEGIERKFDKHLQGVPGKYLARKDARRQLLASLTLEYTEPKGGDDIVLTIDTRIQHILEGALDRRIGEVKAKAGMGIVMDPASGAILALATRPAFDPNRHAEVDEALRANRAVLDAFEPGSAFKIVTAAVALELGLVTPETVIDCENGGFNPYGHYIKDFHPLGSVPFSKAFEQSSNVAIIKVGAMLGRDRLVSWFRRFGVGETTSPDFQRESVGIFGPPENWSNLTMGSLPMGQEVAVTMPQLARAFAVIANGGYLVQPHLVTHAIDRHGEVVYRYAPPACPRIVSGETAATMRQLCRQVVEHGTGTKASIDEYPVGGKTGTAQIALPGLGYQPGLYTVVFAGFGPVDAPRAVCVIVIQEPKNDLRYGGYVCGPVFAEVMRETLRKLHVPPQAAQAAPEKGGAMLADAAEDADTVAPRAAVDALETAEASLGLMAPLDGLELVTAAADGRGSGMGLPDFTGMSKRQVRERLAQLSVPWDPRGAGWVVKQEPAAGTPLNQVRLCMVEFGPKLPAGASEDDVERTENPDRRASRRAQ